MDRKTYMRVVYSQYWLTAREETYGFSDYDKNLCQYILDNVQKGGKILEVAIGTGYPVADFLQKAGFLVHGIDISPNLIKKCRQLYPSINCKVGDAEDLDYPDNYFDCTYCFQSTWYFPDLNKAIDEMLRVTKLGGLVMFDIQNRNNMEINRHYHKGMLLNSRLVAYPVNIIKTILRREVPSWSWHPVVSETPTYPESIYSHLRNSHIANFRVMVKNEAEGIENRNGLGSFKDYARLVFAIKK